MTHYGEQVGFSEIRTAQFICAACSLIGYKEKIDLRKFEKALLTVMGDSTPKNHVYNFTYVALALDIIEYSDYTFTKIDILLHPLSAIKMLAHLEVDEEEAEDWALLVKSEMEK